VRGAAAWLAAAAQEEGSAWGAAWDCDGLLWPAGLGVEGDASGSGLDDAGGKKRGGITFENNLTVQIRLMD
jgi:hypothetical protein